MARPTRRIKLLLVDDHKMVREGLKAMLQPEFEVVGETGLGEEVAGLVEEQRRMSSCSMAASPT